MKRLLGCLVVIGASLQAQTMEQTFLALKEPKAPRKSLSNQLVHQMLAAAKTNPTPSRAVLQRFSEDLTSALVGKDITSIRAAAFEKAILKVLSGKGSTFVPATSLREALAACSVDGPTVQSIVRRFIDIGQEVRGPDDLPVRSLK